VPKPALVDTAPTAHAFVGEIATTSSSLLCAPGVGLFWTFHAVPFQ